MQSSYKRLGKYIRLVKVKNTDDSVKELLGINIDKYFMPSVANIVGTDLSKYQIVQKNQFACNRMHVGRDYRIPVAKSNSDAPFIVSPAYDVFEIIDESILLPDYLMLWFKRREFDRNAWFYTDADVRGGLHWKAFINMQLPIPSHEKQKELIAEYEAVENRIQLNKKLCATLEETAQTIYKHWFEDFEFPDESGKPFKSSGGEMVECEELGKEIPKGWRAGFMGDIYDFQYGKGNVNPDNDGVFPVYGSNGIIGGFTEYNNEDAPVIGHIGINCGVLVFAYGKHFVTYNGVMCNIKRKELKYYGYQMLKSKDLMSQTRGSSQPFVSYDMLNEVKTLLSDDTVSLKFEKICETIFDKAQILMKQTQKLEELKSLLLGKMAVEV